MDIRDDRERSVGERRRRSVRTAGGLLILIILSHAIFAAVSFSRLPEEIPLHFDGAGDVDRAGPADATNWFAILVASMSGALFIGLAVFAVPRISPKNLSIPKKKLFLQLDRQAQARHLRLVSFHVLVLGVTMCGAFFLLHVAIALMAHGILLRFPTWIAIAVSAVVLIEIVIMVISLSRSVQDEIDAHSPADGRDTKKEKK